MEKLTLSPPSTAKVPYANSLNPDETPSNSASHQDSTCLTISQNFNQKLKRISKILKNVADKRLRMRKTFISGLELTVELPNKTCKN